MENLIQHFNENWKVYAAIFVCLAPFVIIFRKYAFPVIAFFLEWVIYCGLFHVGMNVFVRVAAWFNYNTQMQTLVDNRVETGWKTPLIEFWIREEYNPGWIFWLEAVVAVIILSIMFKYRPMKIQKVRKKKSSLAGVPGSPNSRPKYPTMDTKGKKR